MTKKRKKILGILTHFQKKKDFDISFDKRIFVIMRRKTEQKLKLFVWSYIKSFFFSTLKKRNWWPM